MEKLRDWKLAMSSVKVVVCQIAAAQPTEVNANVSDSALKSFVMLSAREEMKLPAHLCSSCGRGDRIQGGVLLAPQLPIVLGIRMNSDEFLGIHGNS